MMRAHGTRVSAALMLSVVCCASTASARAVSFVGSKMVMFEARHDMGTLSGAYTFSRRFSVGPRYQFLARNADWLDVAGAELSVLALRFNFEGAQLNAFVTGGIGALWQGQGSVWKGVSPSVSAWGIAEVDGETRRLYAAAEVRYVWARPVQDFSVRARVGAAPVAAEFDQLSLWVVFQYQYMPFFFDRHSVTPMLRLLYQSVVAEVGLSLTGQPWFAVTAEF